MYVLYKIFVIAEDYRSTHCKTPNRSDCTSDDDDIGTSDKQLDLASEDQDIKGNDFNLIDLSYYKR